jgi:hypothetical protein
MGSADDKIHDDRNRTDDNRITDILVGIGRLEEKADATNTHLAALNGSVQTLYRKAESNKSSIDAAEKALLQHKIDCPGLKTIQEIDRKLASGDFHGSVEVREKLIVAEAKAQDSEKWKKTLLFPLIKAIIIGILILFLMHAHDLLNVTLKGIK